MLFPWPLADANKPEQNPPHMVAGPVCPLSALQPSRGDNLFVFPWTYFYPPHVQAEKKRKRRHRNVFGRQPPLYFPVPKAAKRSPSATARSVPKAASRQL